MTASELREQIKSIGERVVRAWSGAMLANVEIGRNPYAALSDDFIKGTFCGILTSFVDDTTDEGELLSEGMLVLMEYQSTWMITAILLYAKTTVNEKYGHTNN